MNCFKLHSKIYNTCKYDTVSINSLLRQRALQLITNILQSGCISTCSFVVTITRKLVCRSYTIPKYSVVIPITEDIMTVKGRKKSNYR